MTESAAAREQIARLTAGAVDVERLPELVARVERSLEAGKPLRIKVGFDPSAADLHLGHTVVMRKMKDFQDLGHEVWFVVGDFTGRIGDPSGRSKTRPQLTDEQIRHNAETYREQAFRILDRERTVVAPNSEWLGRLGSEGLIRLASRYTVARMLERDDFEKRFRSGRPISIHEFLYPLAQAYDSVAMKADAELGGTDQRFNLLVGRDVMREYGLEPQIALTMPLLTGLDGVQKMSKSLGNAVGVTESPDEMFGKLMSISDDLMFDYFLLLTDRTPDDVASLRTRVASGELHPKRAKLDLAGEIVADFHSPAAARAAEAKFEAVFRGGGEPEDMPEARFRTPIRLLDLLRESGLAESRAAGRRLVAQGGVSLGGERIGRDGDVRIPAEGVVLRVGKRRFLKVCPSGDSSPDSASESPSGGEEAG